MRERPSARAIELVEGVEEAGPGEEEEEGGHGLHAKSGEAVEARHPATPKAIGTGDFIPSEPGSRPQFRIDAPPGVDPPLHPGELLLVPASEEMIHVSMDFGGGELVVQATQGQFFSIRQGLPPSNAMTV